MSGRPVVPRDAQGRKTGENSRLSLWWARGAGLGATSGHSTPYRAPGAGLQLGGRAARHRGGGSSADIFTGRCQERGWPLDGGSGECK